MKRIYICAPFRTNEKRTQQENIAHVTEIGRVLANKDTIPIIPHLALQFLDEATQRDLAMLYGKAMLDMCDEVWICSEHVTEGMQEEMKYALDNSITVINMGGTV